MSGRGDTSKRTVKACPVCGRVVAHSCFHDQDEHPSVLMEIDQSRRLAFKWVTHLERELHDFKRHISQYLT